MRFIIVFLLAGVSIPSFAMPRSSGSTGAGQKNVSWTLVDWLAQTEKFKLQDQWLAANKQTNPMEFNLLGSYTPYDLETGGTTESQKLTRYSAEFYISIFGFEGGVEQSDEDRDATYGQINLRILGSSSQSTGLMFGYGARKTTNDNADTSVTNQYGHVNLQLYIVDIFGFDGTYTKYFSAKDKDHTSYDGERVEYGAFIEFGFLRVFGKVFADRNYSETSANANSIAHRDGTEFGLKLFF